MIAVSLSVNICICDILICNCHSWISKSKVLIISVSFLLKLLYFGYYIEENMGNAKTSAFERGILSYR